MSLSKTTDRIARARRLAASGRYKTRKALAEAVGVHESTLRRHGVALPAAAAAQQAAGPELRLMPHDTGSGDWASLAPDSEPGEHNLPCGCDESTTCSRHGREARMASTHPFVRDGQRFAVYRHNLADGGVEVPADGLTGDEIDDAIVAELQQLHSATMASDPVAQRNAAAFAERAARLPTRWTEGVCAGCGDPLEGPARVSDGQTGAGYCARECRNAFLSRPLPDSADSDPAAAQGPVDAARAAELVERLNAYDGYDWYNDVADGYSDIIDDDELDSYTDGTLPLVDGTTVAPRDYGKWRHYDN